MKIMKKRCLLYTNFKEILPQRSKTLIQEQEKHKEKSMVVYPERGEYYEKPSKRKGGMQIYGINKK